MRPDATPLWAARRPPHREAGAALPRPGRRDPTGGRDPGNRRSAGPIGLPTRAMPGAGSRLWQATAAPGDACKCHSGSVARSTRHPVILPVHGPAGLGWQGLSRSPADHRTAAWSLLRARKRHLQGRRAAGSPPLWHSHILHWEGMDLMGRSRRRILDLSSRHLPAPAKAGVAAIQRQAGSGAWGWLDCGDKPRNDMVCRVLGILADLCDALACGRGNPRTKEATAGGHRPWLLPSAWRQLARLCDVASGGWGAEYSETASRTGPRGNGP